VSSLGEAALMRRFLRRYRSPRGGSLLERGIRETPRPRRVGRSRRADDRGPLNMEKPPVDFSAGGLRHIADRQGG
jgi:hypothetical protein